MHVESLATRKRARRYEGLQQTQKRHHWSSRKRSYNFTSKCRTTISIMKLLLYCLTLPLWRVPQKHKFLDIIGHPMESFS